MTLRAGAWTILRISIVGPPNTLVARELRSLAEWRDRVVGGADPLLGAEITLLGSGRLSGGLLHSGPGVVAGSSKPAPAPVT